MADGDNACIRPRSFVNVFYLDTAIILRGQKTNGLLAIEPGEADRRILVCKSQNFSLIIEQVGHDVEPCRGVGQKGNLLRPCVQDFGRLATRFLRPLQPIVPHLVPDGRHFIVVRLGFLGRLTTHSSARGGVEVNAAFDGGEKRPNRIPVHGRFLLMVLPFPYSLPREPASRMSCK